MTATRIESAVRAQLDEASFMAAVARGKALPVDDAQVEALILAEALAAESREPLSA